MLPKRAVLILSHQGYSYVDDLINVIKSSGYLPCVLSSQPSKANQGRRQVLTEKSSKTFFSPHAALEFSEVKSVLAKLRRDKIKVMACISVWEGYRLHMARANMIIGAYDDKPKDLQIVLDKFRLRKKLNKLGLSKVKTRILNKTNFENLKKGHSKFVKPRRGLGSFGAFRLTSDLKFGEIIRIQKQMVRDREYAGIFLPPFDFVAEDYIPGQEFSFEIIAADGRISFLGLHEKLEVEEAERTTLENCCSSPSISLDKTQIRSANELIKSCFRKLNLRNGCFHVEAKLDRKQNHWEILEINPRVGGALIKESVKATTGGECLLKLWLKTLVSSSKRERMSLHSHLLNIESLGARCTTLFRVYFGTPGKVIKTLKVNSHKIQPHQYRLFVRRGQKLPPSSREVFLGQALWTFSRVDALRAVTKFNKISKEFFYVRYQD